MKPRVECGRAPPVRDRRRRGRLSGGAGKMPAPPEKSHPRKIRRRVRRTLARTRFRDGRERPHNPKAPSPRGDSPPSRLPPKHFRGRGTEASIRSPRRESVERGGGSIRRPRVASIPTPDERRRSGHVRRERPGFVSCRVRSLASAFPPRRFACMTPNPVEYFASARGRESRTASRQSCFPRFATPDSRNRRAWNPSPGFGMRGGMIRFYEGAPPREGTTPRPDSVSFLVRLSFALRDTHHEGDDGDRGEESEDEGGVHEGRGRESL